MSNLSTRVLVAIVGIPVILAVTWAGGYPFYLFMLTVTMLGLREFFELARAKGVSPQNVTGYVLGVLVTTVFVYERFRMDLASWLESLGIAVPTPSMAHSPIGPDTEAGTVHRRWKSK